MTIYVLLVLLGVVGLILFFLISLFTMLYFSYILCMETSYYEIKLFSWFYDILATIPFSIMKFSNNIKVEFKNKALLDKTPHYMLALHPHGLTAQGRIINMTKQSSELYPYFKDTYQGIHSILFRIPILRELCLFLKCIPVNESFLKKMIGKGHNISLYPGGTRETYFTNNKMDKHVDYYYLHNRKGFIRVAIDCKIPVVPILFWNEQSSITYTQSSIIQQLHTIIKKYYGYTINLDILQSCSIDNLKKLWNMFYGMESYYIYVGEPICFTDEGVDEAHAIYIEKIKELHAWANAQQGGVKTLEIM